MVDTRRELTIYRLNLNKFLSLLRKKMDSKFRLVYVFLVLLLNHILCKEQKILILEKITHDLELTDGICI